MSNGVEFEGDKYSPARSGQVSNQSHYSGGSGQSKGLTGWLLNKGIVSSEAAAQKVLVGIIILNIILTFLVIIYFL